MTDLINLRRPNEFLDWAKVMNDIIKMGSYDPEDAIAYQLASSFGDEDQAAAFARRIAHTARSARFVKEPNEYADWHYRLVVQLRKGGEVTLISPHLEYMAVVMLNEDLVIDDWPEGWYPDNDEEAA